MWLVIEIRIELFNSKRYCTDLISFKLKKPKKLDCIIVKKKKNE